MKIPRLPISFSSRFISHVFSAAKQSVTTFQSLVSSWFNKISQSSRRRHISSSLSSTVSTPTGLDLFALSRVKNVSAMAAKDMEASVWEVEQILGYRFKNKKLLEEALTHASYVGASSYERLEFIGDSALGCALSNYFYLAYPDLNPGHLSSLRATNVSTEKLARVAIQHGLFNYVRHNSAPLRDKVREFALSIQYEEDGVLYGGSIKAPKVLADIVESIAAAVYIDCSFDLQALWVIFRCLLEPIVTYEDLEQQPQPITLLFQQCQKQGKQVDIKNRRKGMQNIASVFIDGKFIASSSTEQKETAKLYAAKVALGKLDHLKENAGFRGTYEIGEAKQRLHDLCGKKKWPKPIYSTEKVAGRPAHDLKFICSVCIQDNIPAPSALGDMKSKVKDAENSAASYMLQSLQEYL